MSRFMIHNDQLNGYIYNGLIHFVAYQLSHPTKCREEYPIIWLVLFPFTCNFSPENIASEPLKGFKSYGSRQSLSNTCQYRMSAELPWSTGTLLISLSSHPTVMTTGSSLWGWMITSSFSEKEIVASRAWVSPPPSTWERSSIFRIWLTYLLQVKLVSPPLENPSVMVLSVCHTTLLPLPWDASFSLLGMKLPTSSHPRELDLSETWEKSPFTCFSRCLSLISLSISFLS